MRGLVLIWKQDGAAGSCPATERTSGLLLHLGGDRRGRWGKSQDHCRDRYRQRRPLSVFTLETWAASCCCFHWNSEGKERRDAGTSDQLTLAKQSVCLTFFPLPKGMTSTNCFLPLPYHLLAELLKNHWASFQSDAVPPPRLIRVTLGGVQARHETAVACTLTKWVPFKHPAKLLIISRRSLALATLFCFPQSAGSSQNIPQGWYVFVSIVFTSPFSSLCCKWFRFLFGIVI